MKENRLTIQINRPVSLVFAYTIDPHNTPQWIDSLVGENINTAEVDVGTAYVNIDDKGNRGSYVVSRFEKDSIFQLDSTISSYHVRYTYTSLAETETELEYFEWVEEGELESPFAQQTLDKLKSIIESN